MLTQRRPWLNNFTNIELSTKLGADRTTSSSEVGPWCEVVTPIDPPMAKAIFFLRSFGLRTAHLTICCRSRPTLHHTIHTYKTRCIFLFAAAAAARCIHVLRFSLLHHFVYASLTTRFDCGALLCAITGPPWMRQPWPVGATELRERNGTNWNPLFSPRVESQLERSTT